MKTRTIGAIKPKVLFHIIRGTGAQVLEMQMCFDLNTFKTEKLETNLPLSEHTKQKYLNIGNPTKSLTMLFKIKVSVWGTQSYRYYTIDNDGQCKYADISLLHTLHAYGYTFTNFTFHTYTIISGTEYPIPEFAIGDLITYTDNGDLELNFKHVPTELRNIDITAPIPDKRLNLELIDEHSTPIIFERLAIHGKWGTVKFRLAESQKQSSSELFINDIRCLESASVFTKVHIRKVDELMHCFTGHIGANTGSEFQIDGPIKVIHSSFNRLSGKSIPIQHLINNAEYIANSFNNTSTLPASLTISAKTLSVLNSLNSETSDNNHLDIYITSPNTTVISPVKNKEFNTVTCSLPVISATNTAQHSNWIFTHRHPTNQAEERAKKTKDRLLSLSSTVYCPGAVIATQDQLRIALSIITNTTPETLATKLKVSIDNLNRETQAHSNILLTLPDQTKIGLAVHPSQGYWSSDAGATIIAAGKILEIHTLKGVWTFSLLKSSLEHSIAQSLAQNKLTILLEEI